MRKRTNIKAAFDDIEVRISTMEPDLTTKIEDFDYHLPSASMFFHILGENADKFGNKNFIYLSDTLNLTNNEKNTGAAN